MTMLPAAVLAVLLVGPSAATPASRWQQEPPGVVGRDDGLPGEGITNPELVRMLDTYAIVQAQEALQLSEAQYTQFVARLKRLQETRRATTQRRNRILRQLRLMTLPKAAANENAVRDQLKALEAHDLAAADQMRKAYMAVDEVLDTRQQARFRVFEEQMERKKLDLLMRARDRVAGRRNRGGS